MGYFYTTKYTQKAAYAQGIRRFFSGDSEMFVHSLWAFSQSNLANWMTEDTRVVWVWNWWRAAYIGVEIAAGVLIAAGFVMYVYAELISPYVAESKRRKALKEGK